MMQLYVAAELGFWCVSSQGSIEDPMERPWPWWHGGLNPASGSYQLFLLGPSDETQYTLGSSMGCGY